MDAGLLDVLHHAGDVDGLAVGDAVHVDLDRVVQVAVDQHRVVAGDAHRFAHVAMQAGAVVHDLHGAAAQHVARADHHRIADALGDRLGFLGRAGGAVLRLAQAEAVQQMLEAFAVLGDVDRIGAGAEDRNSCPRQRLRQFQRRLPAVLHDAAEQRAALLFAADQGDHVLGGRAARNTADRRCRSRC